MVEAIIGLIANLAPLALKAGRPEEASGEEVKAALKAALDQFEKAVGGLPAALADNRANAEKILRGG